MLNYILFVVIVIVIVYYYCSNKKSLSNDIPNENKIETFLDYSLVDNKKYPPVEKLACKRDIQNIHISKYQRNSENDNDWVFGYPHYRNYIGGSSGRN